MSTETNQWYAREHLEDVLERIKNAKTKLTNKADDIQDLQFSSNMEEYARLKGKIEGVRLVESYIYENLKRIDEVISVLDRVDTPVNQP